MSALLKTIYTPAEYLAFERAHERRHEYLRGEIFQMAGTSFPHTFIVRNLIHHLGIALSGSGCVALPTNLRVHIPTTGLYTYPDVVIVCGEPELEDKELGTLLNPTCLIEVLSPSTESYDRGAKFGHYRQIPSLKEYIIVAQDRVGVEQFVRQDTLPWLMTPLEKLEDRLTFASVKATIELRDIYESVTMLDAKGRM